MEVYIELSDSSYVYRILDYFRESKTNVTYMEVMRPKYDSQNQTQQVALILSLLLPKRRVHYDVLSKLNEIDYVVFAEEV